MQKKQSAINFKVVARSSRAMEPQPNSSATPLSPPVAAVAKVNKAIGGTNKATSSSNNATAKATAIAKSSEDADLVSSVVSSVSKSTSQEGAETNERYCFRQMYQTSLIDNLTGALVMKKLPQA
jgi:hypothetical protein